MLIVEDVVTTVLAWVMGIGLGLWLLVWIGARGDRRRRRAEQGTPAIRAQEPKSRPQGDPIAGWMVGHVVRHGHQGFPGDPLPGGHLGDPMDLAFWGGIFDEDEDEDEAEDEGEER